LPKTGIPAFAGEMAIKSPSPASPSAPRSAAPASANQTAKRVVQKASFRSPEFIGFFAPISEIGAGLLPTVN
jgi:hypothetical protein